MRLYNKFSGEWSSEMIGVPMKKQSMPKIFFVLFIIMTFFTVNVFAQGFTKINVKNKYGNTQSQQSDPITPKTKADPKNNTTMPTGATTSGTLPEGMIQLNGTDVDIKEMVKSISALTGKNFIINDKVRGKITIISEKPMTKDMAYEAFLSALEINGFTTVMTPSGLINIVPQKDSLSKPLSVFKEDSPNTDKFITRILQMQNISANEVNQVIGHMVSKNGKIQAYPTTNSLIITDTGSNIDHLLQIITELDQEGPQEVLSLIHI